MNFFNLDLHISVIADLKEIFKDLGHNVTSWSISGHSWVFNRSIDKVEVVNQDTWQDLDEDMCDRFYHRYKDELSQYDAFIVTHTPCFSLLFKKFNKPIIVVASTRYEEPFGRDNYRWEWLNSYLRDMIDKGMIIPLANNRYDSEYCELFTQREWRHIPSLCTYTDMKYRGNKEICLLSSNLPVESDSDFIRNKEAELPSPYKWSDLAEYRGIIHIPYNCSTMSIFEQYSANIPMLFPSPDFMVELYSIYQNNGILSQLSWNRVHGAAPGSIIPVRGDAHDPNQYDDISSISEWMKLSDYYDQDWMPHLTYFDSLSDIEDIIPGMNFSEISQRMERFNIVRKKDIYFKWSDIIRNL